MIGDGMWQREMGRRGVATQGMMGGSKSRATAPWDWQTSCPGVANHGPTMGSLTTRSREKDLDSGTAVRCPQG